MLSIRKIFLAMLTGPAFFSLVGCRVEQRTPPTEPLNPNPIAVDAAMQRRDWEPSVSTYKNDTVMAWPDYAPLRAKDMPELQAVLVDPFLFLGNALYIPAGMFIDPPTKMVGYKSLSTPPTYTAMPPATPATQPSDFDIRQK